MTIFISDWTTALRKSANPELTENDQVYWEIQLEGKPQNHFLCVDVSEPMHAH